MKTKSLGWVVFFCLGIGCGGTSNLKVIPLNAEIDSTQSSPGRVQLESPGWVGIVQNYQGKAVTCEKVSHQIQVSLSPLKGSHRIPLQRLCEDKNQRLVFRTAGIIQSGEYELEIRTKTESGTLLSRPKVVIEYQDQNFSEGPDQIPAGAKTLDKNGQLQGLLNPSLGKRTSWIDLPGEGGSVTIGYIVEGNQELSVSVYKMTSQLVPDRLVGVLKPKMNAKFNFGSEPLYVKVEAPLFSNEIKYSIFRKDSAAQTGVPLTAQVHYSVVDRYSLSTTSSVLVIRSSGGMKAGSELMVFGKRAGQNKLQELGRCKVMTVKGPQASCQLDGVSIAHVTQFKISSPLGSE